jgi:hypothetical protein
MHYGHTLRQLLSIETSLSSIVIDTDDYTVGSHREDRNMQPTFPSHSQ